MARTATRADRVRLVDSPAGNELFDMFAKVRGVSGVVVTKWGGLCGRGTGLIEVANDGQSLRFAAPGSTQFGRPSDISDGDGEYTVEDGANPNAYIVVKVWALYIVPGQSGPVFSQILHGAQVATVDDIPAASAGNGTPQDVQVGLKNFGSEAISNLRIWLDPQSNAEFEISSDGLTFYRPLSEFDVDALIYPAVAADEAVSVFVRYKNTAAGPLGNIVNDLRWSWISHN